MRTRRRRSSRRLRRRLRGGATNIPAELAKVWKQPAQLQLRFGPEPVSNGQLLSKMMTTNAPAVNWSAPADGQFRTLLCFDPDAPARAWCHWLIVNCDGSGPLSGETFMEWNAPAPPSGTHRYFVCLFEHPSRVTEDDRPKEPGYFKVQPFINTYGMRLDSVIMFRVSA